MTDIMAQHIYLNHLQLFYGLLLCQSTVSGGCWVGSQPDTGLINGEGWYHMSLVMRKMAFCICENKVSDQLRSNCTADQHLCFRYTDSTIPLLPLQNFKPLAIFCGCTAQFVSDLVGNPEDRFSHNEAQI